jgi:LAS superfamily LD-carboxypeptidase LdcB
MISTIFTEHQLTGQSDSHITWLNKRIGIHQQVLPAWRAMSELAKKDGFDLEIASGYRSFSRQLSIWNRKFSGQLAIKNQHGDALNIDTMSEQEIINAILYFSALPGASRHHWGCDIDIYATNLLTENESLQLEPWEFDNNGPFYPLRQWLAKNASRFDFYFPYDKYRGGVAAEPWHLSYWPIAQHGQTLLTVDCIQSVLSQSQLSGKAEVLQQLSKIYKNYIQNVGSIHYG